MTLQTNIQTHVNSAGEIEFKSWRSFRNQVREADDLFRFVDGEMVERFLDLDESTQAELCKDLGPSVEDVRNLVEELRRMH